jgi:D-alanyl-lipoteichoic acid acyltransferase DltB (MBOAT superfamily)
MPVELRQFWQKWHKPLRNVASRFIYELILVNAKLILPSMRILSQVLETRETRKSKLLQSVI